MSEIIERVERRRKDLKLKKRDICRELGITDSTYGSWVERDKDPDAKYLTTITKLLDINFDYLLTGKDAPEKPSETYIRLLSLSRHLEKLPADERKKIITNMENTAKMFVDIHK